MATFICEIQVFCLFTAKSLKRVRSTQIGDKWHAVL
jgi:hypothetical protein